MPRSSLRTRLGPTPAHLFLALLVGCGGGTTTNEPLAIALAPTLDANGTGFTSGGAHFASCSEFCSTEAQDFVEEGSVQSVVSCEGPVPVVTAVSGFTFSDDGGVPPQVILCTVQVQVGGGCGGVPLGLM